MTIIDLKIRAADKQLRQLVTTTGSRLSDLNGIGPSGAARLLGDIGDIHRFRTAAHFASWNGTAPVQASSGAQKRHRLSRLGNRRINRVLHIMAIVQLRYETPGRVYYRRRLAEAGTGWPTQGSESHGYAFGRRRRSAATPLGMQLTCPSHVGIRS